MKATSLIGVVLALASAGAAYGETYILRPGSASTQPHTIYDVPAGLTPDAGRPSSSAPSVRAPSAANPFHLGDTTGTSPPNSRADGQSQRATQTYAPPEEKQVSEPSKPTIWVCHASVGWCNSVYGNNGWRP